MGPLPRNRRVAVLGHRDVRVAGDLHQRGANGRRSACREQLDPGPAGADNRFQLVTPFMGPRRADHPHYRRDFRDRVRGRRRWPRAAVHFLTWKRGRAQRARGGIAAAAGSISISYGLADLEDLDAVRVFARHFCATHDRIDVLSVTLAPSTPSSARTQSGPS
jgi:hypothetical protein